jgi:ABC-2 type transport system permease protein
MTLQRNVIAAVFRRNFVSYFTNPIGYLFITVFVCASAFLAFCFEDRFFASNVADLNELNQRLHWLLVVFIPAITMAIWADERRSGTDELLLTLPASDLEIVLGKYLSCVAIYTVSLAFSITHVFALSYLGDPDWGLVFSTYFGYWLIGCTLLSAGMVASLLTSSVTIAFIFGALFCAGLVWIDKLAITAAPGSFLRDVFDAANVVRQFDPFGKGLFSLAGMLYFVSVTVVMLYLNMTLLGRRHWAGSAEAPRRWTHALARAGSIAVAATSLTLLAGRAEAILPNLLKPDVTAEQIHHLSSATREMIASIDPQRPVIIQAFFSSDVPRDYVEVRRNLLDTLERIKSIGGNRIILDVHDTELYSDEARSAEAVYSIKPERVHSFAEGRISQHEIFLGLAFKCGSNEKTIPFFYAGLPVEYELTRLIRTVSERGKTKIGILNSDASLFGSFNFQTMQSAQDWQIVSDLKQQYDVIQVSPDTTIVPQVESKVKDVIKTELKADEAKITRSATLNELGADSEKLDRLREELGRTFSMTLGKTDFEKLTTVGAVMDHIEKHRDIIKVLIVPMASSLTDTQLSNLIEYIESGRPALILDDPMPLVNPQWAARERKGASRNPFMGPQTPPVPKGDLTRLTNLLNITFDAGSVIAQDWNPHPRFEDLPPEVVFVGVGSGNRHAFNPDHSTTSGLQEVVFFHPGAVRWRGGDGPEFTPLLRTGTRTATTAWTEIFTDSFLFREFNPAPARRGAQTEFVLAAHIQGKVSKGSSSSGDGEKDAPAAKSEKTINVVFIPDLDIISDQFYGLRRQGSRPGEPSLVFDNIPFVLNCVDFLAGDDSFVELRKKRPKRRTLDRIQQLTTAQTENARRQQENAEKEARSELDNAQKELDQAVETIRNNPDIDPTTKQAMVELERRSRQTKFDKRKQEIEDKKREELRRIEDTLQRDIRALQRTIKVCTVVFPPIPAFLLGVFVFFNRQKQEKEGVEPGRLV